MKIVFEKFQFRQADLGRFVDTRTRIPPPQFRAQAVDSGVVDDLCVSGHRVGLSPRLQQTADFRGAHPPFAVSLSPIIAAGGPIDGHAGGDLHQQDAAVRGRRNPVNAEVQPGLDAVRADLGHELRQRVQLSAVQWLRHPVIGNAQDETSAARVRESREFVGEVSAPRSGDPAAPKLRFLQFQTAVFTESNLFPKSRGIDRHRIYLSVASPMCLHLRVSWKNYRI